jgi:hypothetical protein
VASSKKPTALGGGRFQRNERRGGKGIVVRYENEIRTPEVKRASGVDFAREIDGWCGRGDSNPHPLTGSRFSYHFDFRRRLVGVRGLDYPFAIAFGRRRRPSSLYTFPQAGAWLGIGLGRSLSFPRIWAVLLREFPRGHSSEVCCVYPFATSAFAESLPRPSCHNLRRRARAMSGLLRK